MKLSELVVADAIIPELASTDRNGVIREMVNALAAAMGMSEEDANAISKSVIARENQGSTGFGKGVAVPSSGLRPLSPGPVRGSILPPWTALPCILWCCS